MEVILVAIKDNLYKIGKYLENGASNVAVKSGTIIETTKLSMEISSDEKMIRDIYVKIGEKIYNDYKENKISDKNLISKCEEINHLQKEINSIRKQILKINDKKACKKCGAEMERRATYCPKCGKQQ